MHDDSRSNRRRRRTVARLTRVALATLWPLVHGCDTATGGAVELSWKLRPASSALEDKFVECTTTLGMRPDLTDQQRQVTIARIELGWRVGVGETMSEGAASWPCEDNYGTTGFDLGEGTADLWIRPICEGGQPAGPDTYITPAIVQRRVLAGDTVSLGAVELVVAVSYCDTRQCICGPPPLPPVTPPTEGVARALPVKSP